MSKVTMRNVVQLTDVPVRWEAPGCEPGRVAINHSDGSVYHLSPVGAVHCVTPGTSKVQWQATLPTPGQPEHEDSPAARWGWVHHNVQLDGLLCACSDGQLVVVSGDGATVEAIGEFEGVRGRETKRRRETLAPPCKRPSLHRASSTCNGLRTRRCLPFSQAPARCSS